MLMGIFLYVYIYVGLYLHTMYITLAFFNSVRIAVPRAITL